MATHRASRYLALRTGVAAAAALTAPTFQRGLLPRTASDQAMATAAASAYGLAASTVVVSAVEASAQALTRLRGHGNPENMLLLTSASFAAAGAFVSQALPNGHAAPLPIATASSAAWVASAGGAMTTLVVGADRLSRPVTGPSGPVLGLLTAAGLGGVTAALRVWQMDARGRRLRTDLDERPGEEGAPGTSAKSLARAVGVGAGVGAGLLALAGTEFAIAEGTTRIIDTVLGGHDDPLTPFIGHTVAAATLVPLGFWALDRVRRRVQHADDVVEPAYPAPPTSEHVTAGPRSLVAFDSIGKEGRRFVLMTLGAEQISSLMGEPAIDPVRVVAGFASAQTPAERATLALAELEAVGAYERSMIVVAAPTGVGYVNYSFAEALEYLTRGNCAIIVPQYALVPSFLALNSTQAGVRLQTLILAGIRDRIASMPEGRRPRLVQFGESLGAQVALDVAAAGTHRFSELGLDAGLYLGTPFRTDLWEEWFADPFGIDPTQTLGAVSQAGEIPGLAPSVRHIQVIHHDDPINKFSYEAVVREPWWMGPPEKRPPGVPRETVFRPVTTFVLNLVDLKNGMQTKPGQFVRRGHDYRIELVDAIRFGFGLDASPEQCERMERALREREQEWAARRMVAKRFESARSAVEGQLQKWGVDPATIGLDDTSAAELARGDVSGLLANFGTSGGE